MNYYIFYGVDPICVFYFLSGFVNDGNTFSMTGAQAYVAFLTFLADSAGTKFQTNLSSGSRHGVVTCWSEFIQ